MTSTRAHAYAYTWLLMWWIACTFLWNAYSSLHLSSAINIILIECMMMCGWVSLFVRVLKPALYDVDYKLIFTASAQQKTEFIHICLEIDTICCGIFDVFVVVFLWYIIVFIYFLLRLTKLWLWLSDQKSLLCVKWLIVELNLSIRNNNNKKRCATYIV